MFSSPEPTEAPQQPTTSIDPQANSEQPPHTRLETHPIPLTNPADNALSDEEEHIALRLRKRTRLVQTNPYTVDTIEYTNLGLPQNTNLAKDSQENDSSQFDFPDDFFLSSQTQNDCNDNEETPLTQEESQTQEEQADVLRHTVRRNVVYSDSEENSELSEPPKSPPNYFNLVSSSSESEAIEARPNIGVGYSNFSSDKNDTAFLNTTDHYDFRLSPHAPDNSNLNLIEISSDDSNNSKKPDSRSSDSKNIKLMRKKLRGVLPASFITKDYLQSIEKKTSKKPAPQEKHENKPRKPVKGVAVIKRKKLSKNKTTELRTFIDDAEYSDYDAGPPPYRDNSPIDEFDKALDLDSPEPLSFPIFNEEEPEPLLSEQFIDTPATAYNEPELSDEDSLANFTVNHDSNSQDEIADLGSIIEYPLSDESTRSHRIVRQKSTEQDIHNELITDYLTKKSYFSDSSISKHLPKSTTRKNNSKKRPSARGDNYYEIDMMNSSRSTGRATNRNTQKRKSLGSTRKPATKSSNKTHQSLHRFIPPSHITFRPNVHRNKKPKSQNSTKKTNRPPRLLVDGKGPNKAAELKVVAKVRRRKNFRPSGTGIIYVQPTEIKKTKPPAALPAPIIQKTVDVTISSHDNNNKSLAKSGAHPLLIPLEKGQIEFNQRALFDQPDAEIDEEKIQIWNQILNTESLRNPAALLRGSKINEHFLNRIITKTIPEKQIVWMKEFEFPDGDILWSDNEKSFLKSLEKALSGLMTIFEHDNYREQLNEFFSYLLDYLIEQKDKFLENEDISLKITSVLQGFFIENFDIQRDSYKDLKSSLITGIYVLLCMMQITMAYATKNTSPVRGVITLMFKSMLLQIIQKIALITQQYPLLVTDNTDNYPIVSLIYFLNESSTHVANTCFDHSLSLEYAFSQLPFNEIEISVSHIISWWQTIYMFLPVMNRTWKKGTNWKQISILVKHSLDYIKSYLINISFLENCIFLAKVSFSCCLILLQKWNWSPDGKLISTILFPFFSNFLHYRNLEDVDSTFSILESDNCSLDSADTIFEIFLKIYTISSYNSNSSLFLEMCDPLNTTVFSRDKPIQESELQSLTNQFCLLLVKKKFLKMTIPIAKYSNFVDLFQMHESARTVVIKAFEEFIKIEIAFGNDLFEASSWFEHIISSVLNDYHSLEDPKERNIHPLEKKARILNQKHFRETICSYLLQYQKWLSGRYILQKHWCLLLSKKLASMLLNWNLPLSVIRIFLTIVKNFMSDTHKLSSNLLQELEPQPTDLSLLDTVPKANANHLKSNVIPQLINFLNLYVESTENNLLAFQALEVYAESILFIHKFLKSNWRELLDDTDKTIQNLPANMHEYFWSKLLEYCDRRLYLDSEEFFLKKWFEFLLVPNPDKKYTIAILKKEPSLLLSGESETFLQLTDSFYQNVGSLCKRLVLRLSISPDRAWSHRIFQLWKKALLKEFNSPEKSERHSNFILSLAEYTSSSIFHDIPLSRQFKFEWLKNLDNRLSAAAQLAQLFATKNYSELHIYHNYVLFTSINTHNLDYYYSSFTTTVCICSDYLNGDYNDLNFSPNRKILLEEIMLPYFYIDIYNGSIESIGQYMLLVPISTVMTKILEYQYNADIFSKSQTLLIARDILSFAEISLKYQIEHNIRAIEAVNLHLFESAVKLMTLIVNMTVFKGIPLSAADIKLIENITNFSMKLMMWLVTSESLDFDVEDSMLLTSKEQYLGFQKKISSTFRECAQPPSECVLIDQDTINTYLIEKVGDYSLTYVTDLLWKALFEFFRSLVLVDREDIGEFLSNHLATLSYLQSHGHCNFIDILKSISSDYETPTFFEDMYI